MVKLKNLKSKLRICTSNMDEYKIQVADLISHNDIQMMKQFKHHSSVTCFEHSVNVSICSYLLCKTIGLDYKSAARGGLLHDLFLYDWRVTKLDDGKHGFVHPKIALINAERLFELNDIEKDIIIKHMFPLTLRPPMYMESMVVCMIDKLCTVLEVIGVPSYCYYE